MHPGWRIALVGLGAVTLAGAIGGFAFIGAAIPDEPCRELAASEVAAAGTRFSDNFSSSRMPSNGILIRGDGGAQLGCLQVLDRARCTTTGPQQVRAQSGAQLRFYAIPAGTEAVIRATPSGIDCGVATAPSTP